MLAQDRMYARQLDAYVAVVRRIAQDVPDSR